MPTGVMTREVFFIDARFCAHRLSDVCRTKQLCLRTLFLVNTSTMPYSGRHETVRRCFETFKTADYSFDDCQYACRGLCSLFYTASLMTVPVRNSDWFRYVNLVISNLKTCPSGSSLVRTAMK